eukprot:9501962-Pyramimonas_sp.AAC.1
MAGPTTNLTLGCDWIRRSGIDIDPPTPRDRYLGRGQDTWKAPHSVFAKRTATIRPMLPEHDTEQYTSAANI